MKLKRKIGNLISIGGAVFTICIMIYAAQPWGGNYAYKTLSDYLKLVGYCLWAISPYLILTVILHGFRKNRYSINTAVIGASIIVIASCLILVDAFFIHIDAQNALVLIFLPIYQFLALFVLTLICFAIGRFLPRET